MSPSDQQTVDEEQALITQQTSYGSMVSTRQNQALPEVKVQQKNINIKAALIHVIGDLLQSVGVLIAAFVIYFKVGSGNFLFLLHFQIVWTNIQISILILSGTIRESFCYINFNIFLCLTKTLAWLKLPSPEKKKK